LKLEEIGTLSFEKPDMKRFPCLQLALQAAEMGGSMPAVMNGANEVAVDSFLKGEIGFLQIPVLIEKTMEVHETFSIESVESVMKIDSWARKTAYELRREVRG